MADQAYQTESFKCEVGTGIVARYTYDSPPPKSWLSLDNLESREEGALSTRFGLSALTTDGVSHNFALPDPVNSLSRMQGIGTPYRYAGTTAGDLFRKAGNGVGQFTRVASGLSGGRVSMAPYRPANSSAPWQFIADSAKMLKDNGVLGAAQNWGIAPPTQPARLTLGDPALKFLFFNGVPLTFINYTGVIGLTRVSGFIAQPGPGLTTYFEQLVRVQVGGLIRTGGVTVVNTSIPHGYSTSMQVAIVNPVDPSFTNHAAVITVVDADTFSYANPGIDATSGTGTTSLSITPSLHPGMVLTYDVGFAQEFVPILAVSPPVYDGNLNLVTVGGFFANLENSHPGANFQSNGIQGSVAANTTASLSAKIVIDLNAVEGVQATDDDIILFSVQASDPSAIIQINLLFDVGDGSFTHDYYTKAVRPSSWQAAVSGNIPSSQGMSQGVFDRAASVADIRRLGYVAEDLVPKDFPVLHQLQHQPLNTGKAAWTQVAIKRGEFMPVGKAGAATNNWKKVVAFRFTIQTSPNAGATVGFSDLSLYGASGLDAFNGQPYDYRYTYYNINTGCESSPSAMLQPIWTISPRRQPIAVSYILPTDTQVTHVRIYRRGGTLTSAWYYVDQVPVSVLTSYLDTASDASIQGNSQLVISADPPATTLLPTPVNAKINAINGQSAGTFVPGQLIPSSLTLASAVNVFVGQTITVGAGSTAEQAYVVSVAGSVISAVLQNNHANSGEFVQASTRPQTPMNLAAIAFDQAFLAGDANNPQILYYSAPFTPETFPQQNFIEVGTPDAPIMALVVLRGLLYVFTTKTVWQIFGGSGQTPLPVPTGVMHGLVGQWAWAASENVVYYQSYDGVYLFTGSGATYLTQNTEWIWTSRAGNVTPITSVSWAAGVATATLASTAGLSAGFQITVSNVNVVPYNATWTILAVTPTTITWSMPGVFFGIGFGGSVAQLGGLVGNNGVIPVLDPSQKANIFMAYGNHEVFVCYTDTTHVSRRQIASDTYQRWRNDSSSAGTNITAMFFEQDTGQLIVGKDDGMVYIDRVKDYDSGGFNLSGEIVNPIAFTMQTPQMDMGVPKAFKVWNELTIEATLPTGLSVTVQGLFDSQGTALTLGTIVGTGVRTQYQVNINNGLGQRSLNMGLVLTGSTIAQAVFHDVHIRVVLEAELRKSYDSYKLDFGNASFKLYKQMWAVYSAPDAAGVAMNVYVDDAAVPIFTFTLPQATNRTTQKVRFPALKGRIIRIVGTSPTPFQMYTQDTEVEFKGLDQAKGYTKQALST